MQSFRVAPPSIPSLSARRRWPWTQCALLWLLPCLAFALTSCNEESNTPEAARSTVLEGPVLPSRWEALDANVRKTVEERVAAIRKAPDDAQPRGELGIAYEANGLPAEARASFEQAARLAPKDPVWPYHVAIARQDSGDLAGALAGLSELTQRFPRFAPAHHRLGVLLTKSGRFDEAKRAFEVTTQLKPRSPEGYVGLGTVAVLQRKYTDALPPLDQALQLQGDHKMAHHLRGSALRGLGRNDEARVALAAGSDAMQRYLNDRLTKSRQTAVAGLATQLKRANDFIRAGRPLEGAALLELALQERPNDTMIMSNLSVAYQKSQQPDKALAVLAEAVRIDPSLFAVRVNLSETLFSMKRYDEALREADATIAIAPDFAQAHFARARPLVALQRYEEAHTSLLAARRLGTRDAEVYATLGNVCVRLQRWQEARTTLEQALAALPKRAGLHFNLALACLQLKDFPAADRALQQVRPLVRANHPRLVRLSQQLQKATRSTATPVEEK